MRLDRIKFSIYDQHGYNPSYNFLTMDAHID